MSLMSMSNNPGLPPVSDNIDDPLMVKDDLSKLKALMEQNPEMFKQLMGNGTKTNPGIQDPNADLINKSMDQMLSGPDVEGAAYDVSQQSGFNPTLVSTDPASAASGITPGGTAKSLMNLMSTNEPAMEGVTSGADITKNAASTGIDVAMKTGNPLAGAAVGAGLFVKGQIEQGSQIRKARRQEEQMAADFQRNQSNSSVYADPNSVYYSAADGGPISLSLGRMMNVPVKNPYKKK